MTIKTLEQEALEKKKDIFTSTEELINQCKRFIKNERPNNISDTIDKGFSKLELKGRLEVFKAWKEIETIEVFEGKTDRLKIKLSQIIKEIEDVLQ